MPAIAPLRICLLAAPSAFGGLETVVGALATGLAAAAHDVRVGLVLAPGASTGLESLLRSAEVPVSCLSVPPRAYRLERQVVRQLLESHRPNLLHTHGYRCDVVDAPVARELGIPTVSTVHGFTGGKWRNRFYEWLQIRALRRFDRVVAVSRPMVERLVAAGVPRERLHCVLNAWPGGSFLSRPEARRRLNLPEAGSVVGWVGRLSPEKGPDVFISALGALGGAAPLTCIVGDGREEVGLRVLAARLGVGERIHWPGTVPDAGRFLRAFDVLVVSSRTEGTPMILLEAMAAGVPVVATTVGSVPDVVSPAEAFLVPSDDVPALASALQQSLADPVVAESRATAARLRLDRERISAPWIDRYVTVYRELTPI